MRVGLNLLYLLPGESGGRETYARELIPALIECAPALGVPDLELVAFVSRDAGPALVRELGAEIRAVALPVSTRNRAGWALGELALVASAATRARVDLLHSLANFAPPWGPFRRVVTIHDLQYRAVPEALSPAMRAGTSALMSLAARGADRVIAVSGAGRDEIVGGLRVPHERIDVVPNGVRPVPASGPSAETRARIGSRLERTGQGFERPVVLAVASNLPHKNLAVLLDALLLIPSEERPLLVLAGHATDAPAMREHVSRMGLDPDVRLLSACSTDELELLYTLAACLVLPTLHEGFGLPVLEAMARSVPVACSDIAALREVAGDAALYFDPRSPAQIAARLRELVGGPEPAARLREEGHARAARFSWSAAAEGTLASYRRALGAPRHRPGCPPRGRSRSASA